MESRIWPGNKWAEENETEGGGAGQQGQTDWYEITQRSSHFSFYCRFESSSKIVSSIQLFSAMIIRHLTLLRTTREWTLEILHNCVCCCRFSIELCSKVNAIFPLAGKQLFERDRNLDTSDIQFLEDGNSLLSSRASKAFLLLVAWTETNVKLELFIPEQTDHDAAWRPADREFDYDQHLFSSAAGNNVEVDESLFQDIEDLDLDEDDPDFDPLQMGSDEDWNNCLIS